MTEETQYSGIPFFGYCSEGGNASGIRTSLLCETHDDGDYSGVLIGAGWAGVYINERKDLSPKFTGALIGGLFSSTPNLQGYSHGTISNSIGKNEKTSVQTGLINICKEFNPEGTAIQFGLWNRIGSRAIPLVNIRGLENLFKKKGKIVLAEPLNSGHMLH